MTLLYFSWVRQKLGTAQETLKLPEHISTIRDLANYLRGRNSVFEEVFSDPARLRVALNQEHVAWDAPIGPDDEIAFFPPVTGG